MNKDWLDIAVLEDYLDGKLDSKGMHFVERQALEDPFVAEALAGLSQTPRRKHSLSLLQKQLLLRIDQQPERKKRWGITTLRLSIAAAAAVMFVAVSILFWMKEDRHQKELAGNRTKKVEVNLDPGNVPDNHSIPASDKPVAVAAAKDKKELNEVTIAGIEGKGKVVRSARTAVLPEPQPVTGWQAYTAYLNESNRLKNEVNDFVELGFTIDKAGAPADIKVIKSLGEKYDKEAIRLLHEGSKWKSSVDEAKEIRIRIRF